MGATVTAIGFVTVAGYIFGGNLGLDQMLFTSKLAGNRIAPNTGVNFLLIGLSLLLLNVETRRGHRPAQYLALPTLVITLFVLTGYIYSVQGLVGIASYIPMALNTAIAFAVLSLGVLGAHPTRGLMAAVTSKGLGGVVARRLLPAAIVLPLFLGWLRLMGERAGLYGTAFGTALFGVSTAIIFTALILWNTGLLNRMDRERRRAEETVRESEHRLQAIVDGHTSIIALKDLQGRYILVNRRFEQVARRGKDEILGRTSYDFLPREMADSMREQDMKALEAGGPIEWEEVLPTEDGARTFSLVKFPLCDASGAPYALCSVATDITERKHVEEAVRMARDEAQQASRAKSDFLSRMSHELRTPLNAIIGFSDLLLERVGGELTAKQEDFLRDIRNSGAHLLTLINDILDLSKIEAGRMDLSLVDLDLSGAVEEALSGLRPLIAEKRLEVGSAFDPTLKTVRADKVRLKQILYNLLSNAVKFTPEGGRVRVDAFRVMNEVQVAVVDTGPGIAPEDHARLFQEFTQLKPLSQSGQAGTGLGLSLVRRLVELHGGRVWVETEIGKGSRFVFRLPLPMREPLPASGVGSVLVVEDDPATQKLFAEYLGAAGYPVEVIGDGPAVLECAKRLRPAVICLDIRLPGMQDWEVLRRLKEDPETAAIPVVVATILDDAGQAFALGATRFLTKPVRRDDLLDAVGSMVHPAKAGAATVLVIDDDSYALASAVRLLEQGGYTTITAAGGREGVEKAQGSLPDLIVLDLVMPDVNGFDVIAALRDDPRTRTIPIFVLTVKDLSSEERTWLDGRVQWIASKSVTQPRALLDVVNRLMGRPNAGRTEGRPLELALSESPASGG